MLCSNFAQKICYNCIKHSYKVLFVSIFDFDLKILEEVAQHWRDMSDGSSSDDYSSEDYSDEVSEEEEDSFTETETLTDDLTDSMITESESEPSK